MLVFGRSNPNRKMYPIVFGLVSNEETFDFLHFFESIKSLCRFFNINFEVRFLMQDAQAACAAAAKQSFPNVIVLMCWFHLKQCVKKHLDVKKCKQFKQMIENDITQMHYTMSLENFEMVKGEALARWSLYQDLNDFGIYFNSQWLQSQWTNWKL
ncbi:unnamed protein product, partial [Brachionus calyciflorus]